MKTIWFFERGIEGWSSITGDYHGNWTNLACTWINKNTDFKSQCLNYFTTPFTAALTRHHRALNLSRLIREYSVQDWEINIAAHSEGTATVLLALKMAGWPKVNRLHLLCGACDSNFERNGLNFALRTGKIAKVICYRANRDTAMKIEDTFIGLCLFGISWNDLPLGLSGPMNVGLGLLGNKLSIVEWPNYGHSTCFLPANFERTMQALLST